MSLQFTTEHRDAYAVVRLSGSPTLPQFLAFIQGMAAQSAGWPGRSALFDLRGISTLRAVTDHVAIGQAVAQHLRHLRRIASVVPPDRVTGISRKAAQDGGVNLAVFVTETEAIAWLDAAARPAPGPAGAVTGG